MEAEPVSETHSFVKKSDVGQHQTQNITPVNHTHHQSSVVLNISSYSSYETV
jgi:hypothetical protein